MKEMMLSFLLLVVIMVRIDLILLNRIDQFPCETVHRAIRKFLKILLQFGGRPLPKD